jgi:hypothetical protein
MINTLKIPNLDTPEEFEYGVVRTHVRTSNPAVTIKVMDSIKQYQILNETKKHFFVISIRLFSNTKNIVSKT